MSLLRLTYLPRDLAQEMMTAFKAWARIDHTDDDNAIELVLARTIGLLERQLGILIATQTWRWEPRDTLASPVPENRLACCQDFPPVSWGFLPLPLRGITGFTMTLAAPGTATFRLVGDLNYSNFGQAYLEGIDGATVQPGDVAELACDVTMEVLGFELVDLILRYALFLWENRESATDRGMSEVPDWLNRAWGPFWTPRV